MSITVAIMQKGCAKKKSWIREEILLEPLLAYFDRIQLPDETVNEILGHLQKAYEHEQEFFNQSQVCLRKKLDQIQKRLSRSLERLSAKIIKIPISCLKLLIKCISRDTIRLYGNRD